MIASLHPGTRASLTSGFAKVQPNNQLYPPAPPRINSELISYSSTQEPRFVLEVAGPNPTLYGVGAVIGLRFEELIDQLPGKWDALVEPRFRKMILDPLLRLLPPGKRQQIMAALGKEGAAASLQALLKQEIVSVSAFAVWSGKDMAAAITRRNLDSLPSPMLFLNVKPPGPYSAMVATKLWGEGTHGLQIGGGMPTTLPIPGMTKPAIVMRNIYGGVTQKQGLNNTSPAKPMVKANMLLGLLPSVPFSHEFMGLLGMGLRSAALSVEAAGLAGAAGVAVLSRGTSLRTGLAGFQLLLARAVSSVLRAGGSVLSRTTVYAGAAWSITATAPADQISRLVTGRFPGGGGYAAACCRPHILSSQLARSVPGAWYFQPPP
jgi:hypothetical protein